MRAHIFILKNLKTLGICIHTFVFKHFFHISENGIAECVFMLPQLYKALYIWNIIPPTHTHILRVGLYCNHLVRPFTLSLQISQLQLEDMILYLIYGFGIVTYTVCPL